MSSKTSENDADLVYFLDDDNLLPSDLCKMIDLLQDLPYKMITSKQVNDYTVPRTCHFVGGGLYLRTETGACLTPIHALKLFNETRWPLSIYKADSIFFSNLTIHYLRAKHDSVVELTEFAFNYNDLHSKSWKQQPQQLWDYTHSQSSLDIFNILYQNMTEIQRVMPKEKRSDYKEISFHSFPHILHILRDTFHDDEITYVEIGVWKGITSILMSRHPKPTRPIP